MKAMVIGLRPEYVYPGTLEEWTRSNTLYAANFGASLISNSLLHQFDAEYVDCFDDVDALRSKYDVCILALATHLHPRRDISIFTDVVEQLEMKTIMLSAGISDYDEQVDTNYSLHPSVIRMLQIVSERSEWIGVRGHYSAALLYRNGFRNTVPIGCPSVYRRCQPDLSIQKPVNFANPLVVYHQSLALDCPNFIRDKKLLGQDFLDEVVFTDHLKNDLALVKLLKNTFGSVEAYAKMESAVRENGVFVDRFDEWLKLIGQHDFIVGPRLHGCLAGLTYGIPTVMTPRDLRVREISEFFRIPTASYAELESRTLQSIYDTADFAEFNELYPKRYGNYIRFLNENGLDHKHHYQPAGPMEFTHRDLVSSLSNVNSLSGIIAGRIESLESRCNKLEQSNSDRFFGRVRRSPAWKLMARTARSAKKALGLA